VKIVFLSGSARMGGAERSLLDLAASIRDRHPTWELTAILPASGELQREAEAVGLQTDVVVYPPDLARAGEDDTSVGMRKRVQAATRTIRAFPGTVRYALRLREALRRHAPTVVHSNGIKMHLLGAIATPRGVPLIWHIRDYVGSRRLALQLLRLAQGRCTLAIANSKSVAEDVRGHLQGIVRVEVVHNAIDLHQYAPNGAIEDLDRLASLEPSDAVKVAFVASFAHWKGHEVFLRALAELRGVIPPVRGYVVGGPIYEPVGSQISLDALRQLARGLGIGDMVGFTGHAHDTASIMRASDIIVHASTSPEPFGRVIVEGMGCSRPVVMSRAGGAVELVEEGETALGHRPGDWRGLAIAIWTLASDKPRRELMGAAGRRRAERMFDRTRLAEQVGSLYEALAPAEAPPS
jgi:glycosyltransferase involved in cell wall biosynthesis